MITDLQNAACQKCGLCKTRNHVVNGKGSPQARIFLIGEWPGSPEDKTGSLTRGPIWNETSRILQAAGIPTSDVFMSNVIRCIPKDHKQDKIRDPKKDEMDACAPYLDQEIKDINPTVIVPMGTYAIQRIFGKKTAISSVRGQEIWSEKYNCKIMPVYHPMMLRRRPEYEGFTVEDFRRISVSSQYRELTPQKLGKYVTAENDMLLDKILTKLGSVPAFAYDIETNSLDFVGGKVLCISFSWQEYTGVTIPLLKYNGRPEKELIDVERKITKKINGVKVVVGTKTIQKETIKIIDEYTPYWGEKQADVVNRLRTILANDALKIAHNGKFDNKFLLSDLNIVVNNFMFDTMLAHYLLDENAEGMHGLKDCAWNFTTMGGYETPLEEWFKEKKIPSTKRNYAHVPPEMLYKYAAMDSDCCFRLYTKFEPRIKAENLHILMKRLIMPLSQSLMEAELRGVHLDFNYAKNAELVLTAAVDKKEQELIAQVGKYNFDSPPQLVELLFKKLNLPSIKKTDKGSDSSDEEVLKKLAEMKVSPVPQMILDYRHLSHVLSNYVIGLQKRADANGDVHSSFLIHGTVTGRLSSTDPNLQNIIKEEVEGILIKMMFMARPGYVWIEADYGQAEFRHWANYSQDQVMIQDIMAADNKTGPDIHKKTASEGWGIPLEQVTKKLRDQAKTIVFGIMYGRGAQAVAEEIGITEQQAQKIIDTFFGRYPVAKAWLDRTIVQTRINRKNTSVFGRIRRLPGINSPIDYVRQENERLAVNSPIQSAASDMNCNAANRIRKAFQEHTIDGHMLILVHDAIYCEVAEKDFQRGINIMREAMEKPIAGVNVPMRAEFKVGSHWGNAKEYHFEQKEIKEEVKSGSI